MSNQNDLKIKFFNPNIKKTESTKKRQREGSSSDQGKEKRKKKELPREVGLTTES